MSEPLVVDERRTIPGIELSWTAVRSSGPGGQNVNKVASKIELRFNLAATRALDEETKRRLAAIAHSRLDAEGQLIVVSQRFRQRERNLEDAREKLRELVLRALERPKPRRPTRPTRASQSRRVDEKRRRGARKRERTFDD
jgi:ribosome-associated protein